MIDITDYLFQYHQVKHLTGDPMSPEFILNDRADIQYFREDIYFNIQRKDGRYDMLFYDFDNKEEPEKAINEAYDFKDRLDQEFGIKAYMQLSGNKGAHVLIFLQEPIAMKYYHDYAKGLIKQFNYHYVDDAVFRRGVNLCRFPNTINSKSGKLCEPITETWEPTSLIAEAYTRWEPRHIDHLRKVEAIKQFEKRMNRNNNPRAPLNAESIINHYGITVKNESSDKIRVLCPLHNDQHSSAIFYKNGGFFCSVCGGKSLYQLIAELEDINPADKRRMAKKIKEVI